MWSLWLSSKVKISCTVQEEKIKKEKKISKKNEENRFQQLFKEFAIIPLPENFTEAKVPEFYDKNSKSRQKCDSRLKVKSFVCTQVPLFILTILIAILFSVVEKPYNYVFGDDLLLQSPHGRGYKLQTLTNAYM